MAQGSQPIIGYNYGAEAYDKVRAVIKLALTTNSVYTITATAVVVAFSQYVIRIFNSDPEFVDLGSNKQLQIMALRLFSCNCKNKLWLQLSLKRSILVSAYSTHQKGMGFWMPFIRRNCNDRSNKLWRCGYISR